MATVLTHARDLARNIRAANRQLSAVALECQGVGRQFESLLRDGYTPSSVKTQIDALLVPVGASLDAIRAQLDNLSFKSIERWQIGAPAGVGWLRSGYGNDEAFTTAGVAQGPKMILYNDVAPNINLFSGVKLNDVVVVEGCGANDGRYTVKWDVAAKGDNATYGLENGDFAAGTGWTAGTDWAIASNKATYTYASVSPSTLTNALSGMTASAAYTVQFKLTWVAGVGTIKVDIGGDYYFLLTLDATGDSNTYSIVTNSPSTTPTLTFTATRTSGAFQVEIDDVYVYGAPVLFMVESFAEDAGAGNDTSAVITLEQTAA